MAKTVLILGGSGKIGRHSTKAFEKAGWTVRQYDRKSGDMMLAARGVDVIVNGLNPPNYHNWVEIIPAITRQVIDAAKFSGATVIIPGNVYNFGVEAGPWDEATPQVPCSKKGRIRVEMEEAYRRSGVQTIILRAGNFLDPESDDDIGSMVLFKSIGKDKLSYPGDPNALQAYCYLPDWARAAVGLAEMRRALGAFTDVPLGGLNHTAVELAAAVEGLTGRRIRITGFPWIVMQVTRPFWELAREMLDMRYLWSHPHGLSDERLKALLPGFETTPLPQLLAELLPDQVHPNQPVPAARRVAA